MRPSRVLTAAAAAVFLSTAPVATAAGALTVTTSPTLDTCTVRMTEGDYIRAMAGFSRGVHIAGEEFAKLYPLAAPAIKGALYEGKPPQDIFEAFRQHYPEVHPALPAAMTEGEDGPLMKNALEQNPSFKENLDEELTNDSGPTILTKDHIREELALRGNPTTSKEYARAFVIDMVEKEGVDTQNISERDLNIIYDSLSKEMEPALSIWHQANKACIEHRNFQASSNHLSLNFEPSSKDDTQQSPAPKPEATPGAGGGSSQGGLVAIILAVFAIIGAAVAFIPGLLPR